MRRSCGAVVVLLSLMPQAPAQDAGAQGPDALARELARGSETASGLDRLAAAALGLFGPDSETGRALLATRGRLAADPGDPGAAAELRRGLALARANLEFEPLLEAPLPEGWPEATPVDRIELRSYPAYRAAWVDSEGGRPIPENRMFMTLFRHIQKQKIAMTAPVEMGYGPRPGNKARSMAFLYRHVGQGRPGADGAVEVVDAPEAVVASLGLRGVLDEARLADARARLERWLQAQEGRYEKAGEIRVLGYNSPFVPWSRRYHEIQLPVRPAAGADGQERAITRSAR